MRCDPKKPINFLNEPIVACATPPGTSGLAVIRLSGADVATIVDRLFQSKKPVSKMATATCAVGWFGDIDEVVVTRFVAPHSFTGEDLIEISCHGGEAVKKLIIEKCLESGARNALPGEFSQRAFTNGKIDLTKAEAIKAIINAEAEAQALAASRNLRGELQIAIGTLQKHLLQILTKIESVIEFAEYDTSTDEADLSPSLEDLRDEVTKLLATAKRGKIISHGVKVVLAGIPNAGKSTLLNQLCGADRAIVTPIAGTTRDTIEVRLTHKGQLIILTDTAGIRQTTDAVESIGVARAHTAISDADIVLYLVECGGENQSEWDQAVQIKSLKPLVLILSKSDQIEPNEIAPESFPLVLRENVVQWSCHHPHMLNDVWGAIDQVMSDLVSDEISDTAMLTEVRHADLCAKALAKIEEAITTIKDGWPLEMAATLLHHSYESLTAIVGGDANEEFAVALFADFCVGK